MPATPPPPSIAARHGAMIRDYGGDGPTILFVPSLINPPTILDLEQRSLLRWLSARGRRVLLLDWGWPNEQRHAVSVGGHVDQTLLPLMAELPGPVDLAGYCLGGTMALAAAQHGDVRSLTLIAAPWHFGGFGAERERLVGLWRQSRSMAERLGVLPMEVLQTAFWNLDPERTVRKYQELAEADEEALRAFVTLEDWANDGPPLPFAAASELFEDFFASDRPGRGQWEVAGQRIDPARLTCPIFNIVSTSDRIVPAASAISPGTRLDLGLGHVGMVVGSRAPMELWHPLADWLSRVSPN